MRRDGSDVRRITREGATAGESDVVPGWLADHLLSSRARGELQDRGTAAGSRQHATGFGGLASGELRTLTDTPGEKWYPRALSQSQIAYISGGASGGLERIDGPAGARGEFRSPSWSPDRKTMVFHREDRTPWPPFQPWTSLEPGFQLIRTGIFPSFSPSGDRLVCNSATAGLLHNSILLMNADGSNSSVLFDDPQRSALAPAWSPRGDQIAFGLGGFFQMLVGNRDRAVPPATSQLAVIQSDGTGLRMLTMPESTPDSRVGRPTQRESSTGPAPREKACASSTSLPGR